MLSTKLYKKVHTLAESLLNAAHKDDEATFEELYQELRVLCDEYENTEKNSLLFQVKNLLSYPAIKEKYDKKEIKLHAWYLHIKNAQIEYYDFEKKCFKDLEEYY